MIEIVTETKSIRPSENRTKKRTLFYFECAMGRGVRAYHTIEQAKEGILRETGTANAPTIIRKATVADIVEVKSFGGWVPINWDTDYKYLKNPQRKSRKKG